MARVYYGEFTSIAQIEYRVEIWDDPSGSATGGTKLMLGGEGFTIESQGEGDPIYENFIRKSKATAFFMVNNTTDENYFSQIALTDEAKYALVIFKNNAIYWIGRILPDQMQWTRSPIEAYVEFKMVSVDTLSLLNNYFVSPTWFNSFGRLNILDLIRLAIKQTKIDLYWDYLGQSNDYIRDAVQSYMGTTRPTEFIKKWEIGKSAVIKDFELFTSPDLQPDDSDVFVDCEEIIEDCLSIMGGRLFLDNGRYWIIQPVAYSVYTTSIDYRVYSTAGIKTNLTIQNFSHKVALSTISRPRFESFPTLTNLPSVRYFEQKYKRISFKNVVRPKAAFSATVFEVTNFNAWAFETIKIKATINFGMITFTGSSIPAASKVYIAFRAYSYQSGVIRVYDSNLQDWVISSTLPDYESVECKVLKYEQAGSFNAIVTVDFFRELSQGTGIDDLFFQFQVIGQQNYVVSNGMSTNIKMWGSITAWQEENTAKKARANNATNINASKIVSKDTRFYSIGDNSFSNARGALFVAGETQVNSWTSVTGIYDPLNSQVIGDYLSVHARPVRLIQGNWIDSGTYSRHRTLYFDDSIWVFNGGRFNANLEQWDGEWLRIAHDVEDVLIEDELDYEDYKGSQGNAVVRLLKQANEIRESVNNIFEALPIRMLKDSIGAPTSDPTGPVDYALKINFDPSTQVVRFKTEPANSKSSVLIDGGNFTDKNAFIDGGGFVDE